VSRISLGWDKLYPLWIETRQGRFFTTQYEDNGLLRWVYVVVLQISGLHKTSDGQVVRLYPFWESAPKCKDIILGIWDSYQEAKDQLLTAMDELTYITGAWVLDADTDRIPGLPHLREEWPQITERRPGGL